MFFFFPIGLGGGGFFSFLILYFIIKAIFRALGRKGSTRYYTFNSEDYYNQYKQQYERQQSQASFNKNWYAVLGLTSQASDDEIKKAYRKLILKYHPDRVESADPAVKEQATARFREVQEAYENICKMRNIN